MGSTSYWLTSKKTNRFAAIDQTVTVDVLVVVGGITGLTTACCLRRNGLSRGVGQRGRDNRSYDCVFAASKRVKCSSGGAGAIRPRRHGSYNSASHSRN